MTSEPPSADFSRLLEMAHQQREPQRLLFVFVRRHLDAGATAAQRTSYERGEGGHLEPCMCVDKAANEVASFAALLAESERTGQHWDIVFVSSLEGRAGIAPGPDEAGQPLRFMVKAIHDGRIGDFAAYDREGRALRFM